MERGKNPLSKARRLPLIVWALLAQGLAALCLVAIVQAAFQGGGVELPLIAKLFLQSVFASAFTVLFRLPRWWLIIQFLAPFCFFGAFILNLGAWPFLVVFIIILLLFWNSAIDRVPLYLTNNKTRDALANELAGAPAGLFTDLGCGFGGTLIHLARRFPDWQFVGVEASPLIWACARIRQRLLGCSNIEIRRENLWHTDIADADILYCFLSPAPMPRLFERFRAEAKRNCLLISNSFTVPGAPADRRIEVSDRRKTRLHIWTNMRKHEKN